jgi:hypothetical protein
VEDKIQCQKLENNPQGIAIGLSDLQDLLKKRILYFSSPFQLFLDFCELETPIAAVENSK